MGNRRFALINKTSSGGGLDNVVEDTTPQLGADLDTQTFDFSGSGNLYFSGYTSMDLRAGCNLKVYTDDNAASSNINPGATASAVTSWVFPAAVRFSNDGQNFDLRVGCLLRVNDAANSGKLQLSHDGTDSNITGINTTDLNFTGFTNITVDGLIDGIDVAVDVAANTAKVTNATHTGDVTGATALTIAAASVDIAMLSATGTPSGSTFLRGDNTWSAASGGGGVTASPAAFTRSTEQVIDATEATLVFNVEVFDPDTNYANSSGEITVTAAGYYHVDINVPLVDVDSLGSARTWVVCFLQKDATTSTWATVEHIYGGIYHREASTGGGVSCSGVVLLLANEVIRVRLDRIGGTTTVSSKALISSMSIHKVRDT